MLTATALILYRQRSNSGESQPASNSAPLRSCRWKRICSDDPANEYFSDGMTESLITALSQVNDVKVISRSSVFRFKGKEVDPEEVGRQLGVAAVLEGSVTKECASRFGWQCGW